MLITQAISWPVVNWPTDSVPAGQYAIFINAASSPSMTIANTTATVSYDDTGTTIFLIRPTDGTHYGPAQSLILGNGRSSTRAWLRSYVRKRLSDRIDEQKDTNTMLDDELNDYIAQAWRDYTQRFPTQSDTTITLVAGTCDYTLPTDFLTSVSVCYQGTENRFKQYLVEMPFKGGESTATSFTGYPKLGIMTIPSFGRIYGGHYDIWEGSIHLDFMPYGSGDSLVIRYKARPAAIVDDVTTIPIVDEDLDLLALYVESKVWQVVEGRDASLSRWRTKDDGGKRDDMPTKKMSDDLMASYLRAINERLSLKPKTYRLVRR